MSGVTDRRGNKGLKTLLVALVGAAGIAAAIGGANLASSDRADAMAAGNNAAPAPAAAADASQFDPKIVEQGFRIWKTKIVCGECHGWSGNGIPDNPRQPVGLNLRQTQLDHAGLVEVIKCGRPATGMPHFDQRAYKDDRCYGVTEADLGADTPPGWGTSLIGREIEAVATYIEAKLKGRGNFTDEECQEYFGAGANVCATYQLNRGNNAPAN